MTIHECISVCILVCVNHFIVHLQPHRSISTSIVSTHAGHGRLKHDCEDPSNNGRHGIG